MIAGLELGMITAEFQGGSLTAAQASPASITSAQNLAIDNHLGLGDRLMLLRRNVDNELTLEVDAAPIAYIKALNATGLHAQGTLVFYGDDFTYLGNHSGYELTPHISVDRCVANVAGVVLGLMRTGEEKPYTYVFVDRQQLDTALNYYVSECFGGVEQSEKTTMGLMLNIAVRYLMKWQINSRFPFAVDFSRYYELLELHNSLPTKCQQERQRLVAAQNTGARRFRNVKSVPSTIETLVKDTGSVAPAQCVLKTFQQPKVIETFDYDNFGIN